MRLVVHFAEKIGLPRREPLVFDNWTMALVALHTVPGTFKVVNETPLHTAKAILAVVNYIDNGPLNVLCRGTAGRTRTLLPNNESAAIVRALISGTHPECV